MTNKTLGDLIEWLRSQDASRVVPYAFGSPHSDRGSYRDLAFAPEESSTIGAMLAHAEAAVGRTFEGYKGGSFTMGDWSNVKIGDWGICGENITDAHFILGGEGEKGDG